jgi:myo-inositol 2-dehydrogenase/D-chiro-inositol 1-dehydrogenase
MNKDVIGIGVIGAGRIGTLHAANVAHHTPHAKLVAVADIDLAAAQRVVAKAEQGVATDSYQVLLDNPDVDAVIVASSTDTHAAIMVEAVRHGKHVLCEKPIAQSLAATRQAIEAVHAGHVLVQLGFNRRFDSGFAGAHAAIQRGDIGTPWLVRLVGRDPSIAPLSYLKLSGGQFKDQAIHEFDMARWLMGSEVDEVFASGSALVDPALEEIGDVDTAVTTLKFTSGALGIVDNCRRAVHGYDVRAEVHGSDGTLFVEGSGGPGLTILGRDEAALAQVGFFIDRFTDAFRAEIAQFVECVRTGSTPPAGVEDGYAALRIAVAAGRALREHRAIRIEEVTTD